MTVQREVVVKAVLEPMAERRDVEEKIRAVEEWNNLLLENAARSDMDSYMQQKSQRTSKEMPSSESQLSLRFENSAVSER